MPRQLSNGAWVGILVVATIAAGGWAYWRFQGQSSPPALPEVAFAGASQELAELAVLPTLDTPVPTGKTLLWSSAFALAWRRLRDELAREPIRLDYATAQVDRLNADDHADTDWANGDLLAMAGLARQAFESRVQRRYRSLFADRPVPTLPLRANEVAVYAVGQLHQTFEQAFFPGDEPLIFRDASGRTTAVRSFGVFEPAQAAGALGKQVQVEYFSDEGEEAGRPQWIVDLDRTSQPYQVLVARLPLRATLAETWAVLEAKRAGYAQQKRPERRVDRLVVPALSFRLEHRFEELESPDKHFLNPRLAGLHLGLASLHLEFRLDHQGTRPAPRATPNPGHGPSQALLADGPFLVAVKKRTAKQPIVLLWIATADFLEKHPKPKQLKKLQSSKQGRIGQGSMPLRLACCQKLGDEGKAGLSSERSRPNTNRMAS
jgi:hypothetical protein